MKISSNKPYFQKGINISQVLKGVKMKSFVGIDMTIEHKINKISPNLVFQSEKEADEYIKEFFKQHPKSKRRYYVIEKEDYFIGELK